MSNEFSTEQINALKLICADLQAAEEAGVTFYLLPHLKLPTDCQPAEVDALLCATPHSGYNSRLFFAEPITTREQRNWSEHRILERKWHAFSWDVKATGLTLVQTLQEHLDGLK